MSWAARKGIGKFAHTLFLGGGVGSSGVPMQPPLPPLTDGDVAQSEDLPPQKHAWHEVPVLGH